VPGTPEVVWQAIATGPGISSWFVPTEVEERVGGQTVSHFSPDGSMDSLAEVTVWNPPHLFVAAAPGDLGPGNPTVATEWHVETRSGGACVVRVVHSWYADTDEWDAQFEQHLYGWLSFFRVLRAHLEHFAGQPTASFQVMGASEAAKEEVWARFLDELGIGAVAEGAQVRSGPDAPELAGQVTWAGQPAWPEELLIVLDAPAPGLAHFVPHPMGLTYLTLRFYLSGNAAAQRVAEAEPVWQGWMAERFPMVAFDPAMMEGAA
jgi:uncharacterized protein YndB with AHSA1/START domain